MQKNRKVKPPVPWENHAKSTALFDPKTWTDSSTESCIDNTLHHVFNRKNKIRFHLVSALLTVSLMQLYGTTNAQRISINSNKSSIKQVFQQLEKQSGYSFFYKDVVLDKIKDTGAKVDNGTLQQALEALLKPNGLTYEIVNKTVVIKPAPKKNETSTGSIQILQQYITGKVLDEEGKPIAGASVRQKNDERKVVKTNADGSFNLPITSLNEIIVISFVGFENQEIKAVLSANGTTIRLKKKDNSIDEVVVTGMMTFKKSAFSGASARFNQAELKQVANTNVIQALKSLDPSFLVMENNLAGANPNILPNIELRGQTSISSDKLKNEFTDDPNQPLFVLDGFQTSLRNIMDLDMNRIASITILKDASSTAIYGSRASNGVVVVETIKPKAGEVRLNYTADFNLETADLNSYNMMNAAEKLEFERLSGIYIAPVGAIEKQHTYYDPLYNSKLERVLSGVDTYWLKEPIQTGFSQRHSLYAEGGNENLIFNAGGSYKKNKAVMKGSGRQEWGARVNLTYRKNKISVNNNLTIQGYTADESKYGSFATWVNTNPYYARENVNNPYLDEFKDYGTATKPYLVTNPRYDANLNSYNNTKNWEITNNFQVNYDINQKWRAQASMQINKGISNWSAFTSPLHTKFLNKGPLQKGEYNSNQHNQFSYTANAMLSYAETFGKHTLNANARIEFAEDNNTSLAFTALGFPLTSNGNPAFAYGYDTDNRPSAAKAIKRRNSLISTATYSYDNRYNADLSFNYDGSTAFGKQNVYSPFFSLGGSWNLHNERFLKNNPAVNQLRLRANYGITGNQNFSSTTSISTYYYLSAYNYTGQGVSLATFANENLKWQKTNQLSAGIDGLFFNNRLTVTANVYNKETKNLAVAVALPASTGLKAYPFNAGNLTIKGVELTTKYNVIYKPEQRIVWNIGLTGSKNSQTYSKFNGLLEGLNKSLQESTSLQRYRDGYSAGDLWAVPSAGIDPATGREIFIKKDGSQTFEYDVKDIVSVGNSIPSLQGVISTNLTYKGFTFSSYMRYIWDQDIMNTALFNKVENIDLASIINNNQDKRALYSRWKTPGDVAQFRSIALTKDTQPSSRFIQRENTFAFESMSLAYDFRDSRWIKSVGLSSLRLTAMTNDIFRWSTIRRERGIDYPYAKMYSLTLNANF